MRILLFYLYCYKIYRLYVNSWGKLWFSEMIYQTIIKVWSTFSKVVGVGKAHKHFPLMQANDSQTAHCLALEHNGESL